MRADDYRRRAILAQERAAQATVPRIKEWWEDAARNWLFVAEQVEWLEGVYRRADLTQGQRQPVQQQQQVLPDKKEVERYWASIRAELKKTVAPRGA
jgi:hypothetical protein